MTIATLDDIELDYEVAGSGPDLVWCHGMGGNVDSDRLLAERLAEDYRVLWYSSRGHGRSGAPSSRDGWGYDCFAHDLDRLLDEVGMVEPILCGGSHGANTVLRHAVDHPGRARALVLVAPGANIIKRPARHLWWLVRAALWRDLRLGADGIVRHLSGRLPGDPELDPRQLAALHTHDLDRVVAALRAVPDQSAVSPASLTGMTTPTMIAAWRKDPLIHPWSVAVDLAARLPDARINEIPRITQLPWDEQGDDLAARLHEWISLLI